MQNAMDQIHNYSLSWVFLRKVVMGGNEIRVLPRVSLSHTFMPALEYIYFCVSLFFKRAGHYPLEQWFLTLGNPGILGLQIPEAPTSIAGGEGFWEL